MDIPNIVNLGVGGLSVFLMYRLAANHLDHNTRVIEELTEAIHKLQAWLESR